MEDIEEVMKNIGAEDALGMVTMYLFLVTKGAKGATEEEIQEELVGCLPADLLNKCYQYITKLVAQNQLAGRKN